MPEGDDQHKQLEDYYHHLEEKYGKDKFCLVYLTPNGDDPSEDSIKRNLKERLKNQRRLVCVSCMKWIEACCWLCESDKFRWFLRDFMDHMNGGQTMAMRNEREIIRTHALEKGNLEIALDINFAFNGDLHGQIIAGFLNKLKEFVLDKLRQSPDRSKWDVNNETLLDSPLPNYADFSFGKMSWEKQYGVGLQLQQPPKDNEDKTRKVIIGVWKPEDDLWPGELEERLRNKLNRRLGREGKKPTKNWLWYYYLDDDPYGNWNGKDALIKLYNGQKAVKDLGQKLVEIIEEAAPIIDEHVQES